MKRVGILLLLCMLWFGLRSEQRPTDSDPQLPNSADSNSQRATTDPSLSYLFEEAHRQESKRQDKGDW